MVIRSRIRGVFVPVAFVICSKTDSIYCWKRVEIVLDFCKHLASACFWAIVIACCVVSFRLNFRRQRFAVSLTYFERALDMMQKKYGHGSAQLISVYQSLGRVSLNHFWITCTVWLYATAFSVCLTGLFWSYCHSFISPFSKNKSVAERWSGLLNTTTQVEQGKGKQADHMRAVEHFLQAHSIASSR